MFDVFYKSHFNSIKMHPKISFHQKKKLILTFLNRKNVKWMKTIPNTFKLWSIEMLMIRLKFIQLYGASVRKKWVCEVFVYKFA